MPNDLTEPCWACGHDFPIEEERCPKCEEYREDEDDDWDDWDDFEEN